MIWYYTLLTGVLFNTLLGASIATGLLVSLIALTYLSSPGTYKSLVGIAGSTLKFLSGIVVRMEGLFGLSSNGSYGLS